MLRHHRVWMRQTRMAARQPFSLSTLLSPPNLLRIIRSMKMRSSQSRRWSVIETGQSRAPGAYWWPWLLVVLFAYLMDPPSRCSMNTILGGEYVIWHLFMTKWGHLELLLQRPMVKSPLLECEHGDCYWRVVRSSSCMNDSTLRRCQHHLSGVHRRESFTMKSRSRPLSGDLETIFSKPVAIRCWYTIPRHGTMTRLLTPQL